MTPVVPASIARTVTPVSRPVVRAQLVEDHGVDAARGRAAPRGSRRRPRRRATRSRSSSTAGGRRRPAGRATSSASVALERQAVRPGRASRSSSSVQVEQPDQLGHRVGVVVDAQVDQDVAAAAVPAAGRDDEQRRGLPAAAVAAGAVARRAARPAAARPAGRSASVASQAASIASTTSGPVRMLPCTRSPSPVRPPAQACTGAGVGRRRRRARRRRPACRCARPLVRRRSARRATCLGALRRRAAARARRAGRRGWPAPGWRRRRRRPRPPGTAAPTARNFEATATPSWRAVHAARDDREGHGPRLPTATGRRAAGRAARPTCRRGRCTQRQHEESTHAHRSPDRRRRLPRPQRGHPGRRPQGRARSTATSSSASATAGRARSRA